LFYQIKSKKKMTVQEFFSKSTITKIDSKTVQVTVKLDSGDVTFTSQNVNAYHNQKLGFISFRKFENAIKKFIAEFEQKCIFA